jgi:hypothetical protein
MAVSGAGESFAGVVVAIFVTWSSHGPPQMGKCTSSATVSEFYEHAKGRRGCKATGKTQDGRTPLKQKSTSMRRLPGMPSSCPLSGNSSYVVGHQP